MNRRQPAGWLFILVTMLTPLAAGQDGPPATDRIAELQDQAIREGQALWGHWGTRPDRYTGWSNHSNRLVPVYTFGVTLDAFQGSNSVYRDPQNLTELYGRLPESTLHPDADYFDQTDIWRLQKQAIEEGRKYIFLVLFDGMDWQTTQAAAIFRNRDVTYREGRGHGLSFQDYNKTMTDFGYFVCSPHNASTKVDVDAQIILDQDDRHPGGYSPRLGGFQPWDIPASYPYLIRADAALPHAFTDSASSATSMTCGIKTFNGAINVDAEARPVEPLARQLQQRGFAVGIVSSVPISHATPACAYANNVTRNDYQDISRDLLGLPSIVNRQPLSGMDVVLGCGWGVDKTSESQVQTELRQQGVNFVPGNEYLAADDLFRIAVENGGKYEVAVRQPGKAGAAVLQEATQRAVDGGHRLLGFFGTKRGNLPYATADGDFRPVRGKTGCEVYSEADLIENPTLSQMTEAALTVLETNGTGFWLMVEAGDVDWASHDNNIDNAIGAVFSGEAAFQSIIDWIDKRQCWDESAVIVTADHGHLLVLDDPSALVPLPAAPATATSGGASR
jgi:alkaline phosphatase